MHTSVKFENNGDLRHKTGLMLPQHEDLLQI